MPIDPDNRGSGHVLRRAFVAVVLLTAAGCSPGREALEFRPAGEVPEVVVATVNRLLEHYGDGVDASAMPEPHRVVLFVCHAHLSLRHGGFRTLFDSEFPGDPDFRGTLQAFETIGAADASDAFRRAFSVFPDSIPPVELDDRRAILRSARPPEVIDADGESPDTMYLAAMDDVVAKLEAYIAEHEAAFAAME